MICPGLIRTPIMEGGRFGRIRVDPVVFARYAARARPFAMDPSLLAQRVLKAVDRNRAVIIEPKWVGCSCMSNAWRRGSPRCWPTPRRAA